MSHNRRNETMLNTEHRADHAIVTDTDESNVRYIVMQDIDTESPTQWGYFDAFTYRAGRYGNTDERRAGENRLAEIFFRLWNERTDDDKPIEILKRWMNAFTDMNPDRVHTETITGYSQSDWADVLFISDDDAIDAESCGKEYEQWWRGDVWYVFAEQQTECEQPDYCHSHNDDDHWSRNIAEEEGYHGYGGIYADTAEDAAKYYQEELT